MATLEQYEKMTTQQRRMRYFSKEFKRKKVTELERNQTSIAEISREYQVSRASVYRWLYKYSAMKKKGQKQVLEVQSDTRKLQYLQEQLKEMERIIGQKQMQIDFLDKMIELAEEQYRIDIKKKFSTQPSAGSGQKANNTASK
jgi:transposase